jgi:hypothetical protein
MPSMSLDRRLALSNVPLWRGRYAEYCRCTNGREHRSLVRRNVANVDVTEHAD